MAFLAVTATHAGGNGFEPSVLAEDGGAQLLAAEAVELHEAVGGREVIDGLRINRRRRRATSRTGGCTSSRTRSRSCRSRTSPGSG